MKPQPSSPVGADGTPPSKTASWRKPPIQSPCCNVSCFKSYISVWMPVESRACIGYVGTCGDCYKPIRRPNWYLNTGYFNLDGYWNIMLRDHMMPPYYFNQKPDGTLEPECKVRPWTPGEGER